MKAFKRTVLRLAMGLNLFCFSLLLIGQDVPKQSAAKFEPADGQVLVFVGQDLAAIGGLDEYSDGYVDHFQPPAGFTTYTSFSTSGESYGYFFKGNDGITDKANWGAGDLCADCVLADEDFEYSMIAIGLSLVNQEKNIAQGKHDEQIQQLALWIKNLSPRPVFLRVGYEFDGWDWNHYSKKYYLQSWQRISSIFKDLKIDNVALVWQSKGTGSGQKVLEAWYPGDEVVDWVGYSYFGNSDKEMLAFARKHGKPVFIAEATPVFQNRNLYFDSRLAQPKIAKKAWEQWFKPFFKLIDENRDLIKAFSYINTNWPAQPMWRTNPTFKQVDSRIQIDKWLAQRWREELGKDKYLHHSQELWKD